LRQYSENAHQICGAIFRKALSATKESNDSGFLATANFSARKIHRSFAVEFEDMRRKCSRLNFVFADKTGNESDIPSMDPTLKELFENSALSPSMKTKKMNAKARKVFRSLQNVAKKH